MSGTTTTDPAPHDEKDADMKKNRIAAIALAAGLVSAFPTFVLSLVTAVLIFGGIAFAGAMLVDRYGNLPGGDRRCA
jgi:hypothetical protein